MRRVFPAAVLAALFFVPGAGAWAWPAAGDVVQPFSFDPAHPYAAGQHRGVDIAGDAGSTVVAPEGGSVSFAGTVPTSGKSVTILTGDGYAVTLTHLGSVLVTKGAAVAEGDAVGTIGPSGDPEVATPYVHLGIRIASDEEGYLDPARVLARSCRDGAAVGGRAVAGPHASAAAADDRRRSHCAGCAGGRSSPDRCCRRPGRLDRLGVDHGPVRGPCRCSGCDGRCRLHSRPRSSRRSRDLERDGPHVRRSATARPSRRRCSRRRATLRRPRRRRRDPCTTRSPCPVRRTRIPLGQATRPLRR